MEYKDYYKILGIDKNASTDDIKKAYRRLARKYHPDVSKEKDAEEQFKAVQEAYAVLKDQEKRAAYDQLGSQWQQGQEFRPPPNRDENARYYTSGGAGNFSEEDLSGFSDFFSEMFGARTGPGRTRTNNPYEGMKHRGSDQHARITVSLSDAFNGAERTIQLQMPEIDSQGQVQQKLRTLKVNIPKGVRQGQQLRLSGQGGPGIGGGPAGDLFLEIQLEPHPYFNLQGKNIYLTLPVTPWEAALGAKIQVPTLAGKVDLTLTPGSQAGKKLRLKGRGMPGKTAGDQYVILQILTPPASTDEQKALYQKMSEKMPFDPRRDWLQ